MGNPNLRAPLLALIASPVPMMDSSEQIVQPLGNPEAAVIGRLLADIECLDVHMLPLSW
ncbi:hypothetical protein QCA50_004495 [Cerrena zonata]|uniref:Uncharacterized protein n=1 Tax=Cerrena zonata TaxID=2478898 RepID=A0AAW0GU15_9APHY